MKTLFLRGFKFPEKQLPSVADNSEKGIILFTGFPPPASATNFMQTGATTFPAKKEVF
jgi:hypothetical protein